MTNVQFTCNYLEDGMAVLKNLSFLDADGFKKGYERAVQSGGFDFKIKWRFHTCLWAAFNALKVKGDFVECGVGKGFISSGIMAALNWDSVNRQFHLFDSFAGITTSALNEAEAERIRKNFGNVDTRNKYFSPYYAESYEKVVDNFSEWKNVQIVRGNIPDTLSNSQICSVAYLHIDMNCIMPEIEAINFFWPKLTQGAVVILDDFAHVGFELQHHAWNEWSIKNNIPILSLPTGQGLILKL